MSLSIQIRSPISVPSSLQIFPITDNETASTLTIFDIVVGDIPVLSIKYFSSCSYLSVSSKDHCS